MSDEERKELDNTYAKNSSFLMDPKIRKQYRHMKGKSLKDTK